MASGIMQLVIRADAGPEIGVGHVMRMAALGACAVQNGCPVTLAYQHCPPSLLERLATLGIATRELDRQKEIEDLRSLLAGEDKSQSVLVLDGYQFDEKYQQKVSGLAGQLAIMDDYAHLSSYQADLIINQNPGAQNYAAMYRDKAPAARLLLGPQYVLLRPEFLRIRKQKMRDFSNPQRFLISLGGSDVEDASRILLNGLISAVSQTLKEDRTEENIEITVVVGASNPHKEKWGAVADTKTTLGIETKVLFDVENMAALLNQQQVILTAGGTTVLESAYLGLACFVLITAENQIGILNFSNENKVHYLGNLDSNLNSSQIAEQLKTNLNAPRLEQLAANASNTIKGDGAQKLLTELGLFSEKS